MLQFQQMSSFTNEIKAKAQYHKFLIGRGGANIRKARTFEDIKFNYNFINMLLISNENVGIMNTQYPAYTRDP